MATITDAPFIITRREARTTGSPWYFEKPCIHGHKSKRNTSSKKCLECHRHSRARLRADQPGRVKEHKAASYLRNRDKVIAASKAYIAANPDKVRERRRKHREANKEQIAVRMSEWAKANRPKLRVHERNRRDRKRGAEGQHTYQDIQEIGAMQRWRCANPKCRISVRAGHHIDHIQPIARGGSNDRRNLQLLCQPCNQSKHARPPLEWARMNGLLL